MTTPETANAETKAPLVLDSLGKKYVSHNHQVARKLAAAGIAVFPANPAIHPKKLPDLQPHKGPIMVRSWPKEATADPATIDNWWRAVPEALVAISAKQLGLFIVDADRHRGKPDGFAAFEALITENGGLPEGTVIIDTQNNGRHYVFNQPEGLVLGNSSGGLPPEVDTRGASGDGGYIIAPGTVWMSPDGEIRRWREAADSPRLIDSFTSKTIPKVPPWIISLLQQPKRRNASAPLLGAGQEPPFPEHTSNPVERPDYAPPPQQYSGATPASSTSDWLKQAKTAEDLELVGKAIYYISADSRETWLGYGGALFDRFGETGRSLWDAWSKTCPEKFDPADQDKAWRSFDRGYAGKRITIGSIIYDARMAGFKSDKNGFQKEFSRDGSATGRISSHSRAEKKSNASGDCDSIHTYNSRPEIQISGGGISDEADRAEEALIASGIQIFQRSGELVFPCPQEVVSLRGSIAHMTRLVKISEARMVDALCRSAIFKRRDKTINPPVYLAKTILARSGQWPFPYVSGVASAPIIRIDGSIIVRPGYDPATRLFLGALPEMPSIADNPDREDALMALRLLEELLAEFPFVDVASRAAALSAIISPVVRSLLSTVPIHIASAPSPGSGKSFLVDLAAMVATGEKAPATGYAKSADENEKRIDGALLDGSPIFSFDNVNGELNGDKLCQAIERPIIDVRRLSSSEKYKVESQMTIYATGNNIFPVGDMARRSIMIRLDASLERPEMRQFRTRPDQLIRDNRGAYVAACMTIVRAYILAGKPGLLPCLASFEDWSDYVRSALVWLGYADPVETMKLQQEEDPEHQIRKLIFRGLYDAFGVRAVTVKEMISAAQEFAPISSDDDFGAVRHEESRRYPDLHEGLLEIAGKNGHPDPELLGKWLRSNKGRIADGLRLNSILSSRRSKWLVTAVD